MSDSQNSVPFGYCHCGCGEKTGLAKRTTSSKGRVKGQPARFLPGHTLYVSPPVVEDRGYESPCWIWQGSLGTNGYAKICRGGKTHSGHRWMYERHRGPIPAALVIDHLCRVRSCVNPDHLEPVTNAENLRRGAAAAAGIPIETLRDTHCIRGHEWNAENTYYHDGARTCRICRDTIWNRTR